MLASDAGHLGLRGSVAGNAAVVLRTGEPGASGLHVVRGPGAGRGADLHPELGRTVRPSSGPAETDFVTALPVISLTLTYLMQVYSALRERNTLGLVIDTLTLETGDAAKRR